jgi:hypothetical protein
MKKQCIITWTLGAAVVLFLVGLILYGRGKPVLVIGQLKPEEVRAIQRDFHQLQGQNIQKALASADLPFLFRSLRELAFSRVREIASSFDGQAVVSTGYVWNSGTVWVCDLKRTPNGWRVP